MSKKLNPSPNFISQRAPPNSLEPLEILGPGFQLCPYVPIMGILPVLPLVQALFHRPLLAFPNLLFVSLTKARLTGAKLTRPCFSPVGRTWSTSAWFFHLSRTRSLINAVRAWIA